MPTGIYKHYIYQGFQKGNKVGLGRKHTQETKERMSNERKERFKDRRNHPKYKQVGTITLRKGDTYYNIKVSDTGNKNTDWMLMHRHVMEKYLNRKLKSNEIVHHINGIRTDNRIKNLAITDNNNHERGTMVRILQKRIRELENGLRTHKRLKHG